MRNGYVASYTVNEAGAMADTVLGVPMGIVDRIRDKMRARSTG